MQSDNYAMVEKILRDVESIINRDEDLEEFVIIPVSLNQNKSPVIHVEHNLGLESWCVKHIYSYAYQKLLEVRKLVAKKKLLNEQYKSVNRLILGALLINPDVSTFWNMRRELVSDNILNTTQELKIAKIILSHKSKSNEAFSYRKWLLRRILADETSDKSRIHMILNEEFKVCSMTAQKSQNNYHSWCHRIWCMENILPHDCDLSQVLALELKYSENWVSKHISEHTGFHYRQYVLNQIANVKIELEEKYLECFYGYFDKILSLPFEKNVNVIFGHTETNWNESDCKLFYNIIVVLVYDLTLNSQLNDIFPEHEALWCHRRYILHKILSLMCAYFGVNTENNINLDLVLSNDKREYNVVDNKLLVKSLVSHKLKENGEKYPKILKSESNLLQSSKIYRLLIENEQILVENCCKMNNRQKYLAQRHEKWLSYILGLSDL